MKKLLLATLLASACGISYAQSNVSIYGLLDQSYYGVQQASGATQIQNGLDSAATATSRIGFKGSEDIGGGLKVGFNLESQINLATGATGSSQTGTTQATTGTSEVFNRAANISLNDAKIGELKIGRQTTPIYGAMNSADALGINSLGLVNNFAMASVLYGTNAITGQNAGTNIGGASANGTIPNFFSNGLSYTSPTFVGVNATLFTSPGSGSTTTTNSGAIREALVNYTGSGVVNGLNAVAGYGTTDSASGAPALARSLLGVNYTWNKFKFSVARVSLKFTNSVFSTVVGDNTDITNAGIKYQVTAPLSVGIETTTAADKNNTSNKSTTNGVAANYDLSKRTAVYAFVGFTKNQGASQMTPLYGAAATGTPGVNNTGYALGLRHTF